MSRFKTVAAVLGVLSLAGCWSQQAAYSPSMAEESITKMAVLPLVDQAGVPRALPLMSESLEKQLAVEKKYDVLPKAKVYSLLSEAGNSPFPRLMATLNRGEAAPEELLLAMAKTLEVDALFMGAVLAYQQVNEQGTGLLPNGGTSFQTFPVTLIELKGEIWSAKSRSVVWRREHQERYYQNTKQGMLSAPQVMERATRALMADLPERK